MNESKFFRVYKRLIPQRFRPLVLRYQEAINYVIFGGLTTVVNLVIYYPLKLVIDYLIANVVAWVGSVIFAFFVNKAFVFEDSRWDPKALLFQGTTFASARLLSLAMEELILIVFVSGLGMSENIMKLLAQIIVIIVNFVASKFIIFRKKQ